MFLHSGRTFNVTATGSALREVRCEKCGVTYYYDMIRTGTGSGASPLSLNNHGAARRAERRANERVDDALRGESDLVPCPDCGWFQTHMIRDARRESRSWMRVVGYAVPALGLLVSGLLFLGSEHQREPGDYPTPLPLLLLILSGISVTVGGLLLWLRRGLAMRIDPNGGFPDRRPEPIPGMPPALKAMPAPPGAAVTRLVVADLRPPEVRNGCLTVQMPRVVWPPHCCNCMGVAQTTYRRSLGLSQEDGSLALPLCNACARRLAWRTWLWGLIAWPVSFLGLALIILPLPAGDPIARVALVVVGTLVAGTVLMFTLPGRFVRPSRVKAVDRRRAIYRIRFANPQYAEAVARFYDGAAVEPAFAQPSTGGFPIVMASPAVPASVAG